jgi:hypothetical protein
LSSGLVSNIITQFCVTLYLLIIISCFVYYYSVVVIQIRKIRTYWR